MSVDPFAAAEAEWQAAIAGPSSNGVAAASEETLPPLRHPQLGAPVKVYDYVAADGELVFVVARFEPGPDGETKTFRQARLEQGRWVWNLQGITSKPLYRLPRILEHVASGSREPIYVAAGEKDVEAIEAAGAVATCCPMGEGQGKWLDEHTAALADAACVTIVADYDELRVPPQPANARPVRVGFGAALYVYRELAPLVATLDVVRAIEGKDSHDHLAAGHPLGELVLVQLDDLEFEGVQPARPPRAATVKETAIAAGATHPLTDYGNAERLVDAHGDDIRYVPQLGWHAWDGRRWQPDGDGEVHRRAKQTVRAIARQALDHEGDARDRMVKHAFKSEQAPRLEAIVKLAQTERDVVAAIEALDRDPYALNVRNGTLDLATGTRRAHDRADHITKLAPVEHDPTADCPTWRSFLETIFARDDDTIAFVQRAVGYSLTGSTEEQVLFVLHGRGENGKSTFVDTLQELLGDYAQQAPTEMLMQQSRARGGATPDLARLPGARFVSAVETGEGRRIDEPLVKQLTGGDRITARRLYREPFEFTPTHKLWLATNHLPQIAGTDHAIWRRVRLIPFAVTIAPEQKDLRLKQKLLAEGPGILRWALAGCAAWLAEGLATPACVLEATQAYRDDMDELGAFLDECLSLEQADNAVKASILYTRYGYWAQGAGATPITPTAFGRALTERGFQKTKRRDGWHYLGVTLAGDQAELN